MTTLAFAIFVLLAYAFMLRTGSDATNTRRNLANSGNSPGSVAQVRPLSIIRFRVLVSRDSGAFQPVEDCGPLRFGDAVRFSAEISKPAYAKIFWVDARGQAVEFYPQDPLGDTHGTELTRRIECPRSTILGFHPLDPSGLSESAFLVVDEEPIENIMSTLSRLNTERDLQSKYAGVNRFRAMAECANGGDDWPCV